jgi:sulfoxide reductase heme-binding subunit YedZ
MTVIAAGGRAYWYLTRSTGIVSLLLLTAIVILGTLSPMRLAGGSRWPRFVFGALHRDLSLLALAVLAVHIVTSVLDSFAPIGWFDAVMPLHSAYRSLWVGLGALAFDLFLALVITSIARRRLGYERWHCIHWLAYACWPIAVLHGLGTGSDVRSTWLEAVTLVCIVASVVAILVRIASARPSGSRARTGWATLTLAAPIGTVAFALLGPMQPGWAASAGTPPALLHGGSGRSGSGTLAVATARAAPRSFSARVSGRRISSAVRGGTLIDLSLALTGRVPGELRVRLAGKPISGGGLSLVGSDVELSAPALGTVLTGSVVSLDGTRLRALVRQSGGHAYELDAALRIPSAGTTVSGLLDAVAVAG